MTNVIAKCSHLLLSKKYCCTDFVLHSYLNLKSLVDMAPKYILEQFLEAELLVNITEHMVRVNL